jgi:hypothetical protein
VDVRFGSDNGLQGHGPMSEKCQNQKNLARANAFRVRMRADIARLGRHVANVPQAALPRRLNENGEVDDMAIQQ